MSDSAKVSNSKPLDAAPPETDLRAELAAIIYEADFRSNFLVIADAVLAAGYRRPDALREKVMAAIHTACDEFDEAHSSWSWFELIDALEAAVAAAVLEAQDAN